MIPYAKALKAAAARPSFYAFLFCFRGLFEQDAAEQKNAPRVNSERRAKAAALVCGGFLVRSFCVYA